MPSTRPKPRPWGLLLAALMLNACGPTGNRLNTGVISDPRTQPDSQGTTGNQGTATPSSGADTTPANPSNTAIPTNLGGNNANNNTSSQTTNIRRRVRGHTRSYTSPDGRWSLRIGDDGHFVLERTPPPARRLEGRASRDRLIVDRGRPPSSAPLEIAIVRTGHGLIAVDGAPLGRPGIQALLQRQDCPGRNRPYHWLTGGQAFPSQPPSQGLAGTSPPGIRLPCDDGPVSRTTVLPLPMPLGPVSVPDLGGQYTGLREVAGRAVTTTLDCNDLAVCRQAGPSGASTDWHLTSFNEPMDGELAGTTSDASAIRCIAATGPKDRIDTLACRIRPPGDRPQTLLLHRIAPAQTHLRG